jgi:hypothetical protein
MVVTMTWLQNMSVTNDNGYVPFMVVIFLSSSPACSGVRVAKYLVFCVMFCGSFFVLFLLAIALSVQKIFLLWRET